MTGHQQHAIKRKCATQGAPLFSSGILRLYKWFMRPYFWGSNCARAVCYYHLWLRSSERLRVKPVTNLQRRRRSRYIWNWRESPRKVYWLRSLPTGWWIKFSSVYRRAVCQVVCQSNQLLLLPSDWRDAIFSQSVWCGIEFGKVRWWVQIKAPPFFMDTQHTQCDGTVQLTWKTRLLFL